MILIIGAGLFGAVCARELKDRGKQVVVVERREHIGGNVYTEHIDGIDVHRYGPHIFHTDNRTVWEYVQRFADFDLYMHSPMASYYGEVYSLPINLHTLSRIYGTDNLYSIEKIHAAEIMREHTWPRNLEEAAINRVGRKVYEKLIKDYTEKQWGKPCNELPPDVIKRIPVRMTYDTRYFDSRYQGIPADGYTAMVERMLEGIEVHVGVENFRETEAYKRADIIIYTGSVDEYCGYRFGKLEYRSLAFKTEKTCLENYQGCAVMNYTGADAPWTRIVEHKWFQPRRADKTKSIITKEYSIKWSEGLERYYPMQDDGNRKLYRKYAEVLENRVMLGGRLGEYKYYDMDKTIESALYKTKLIG